nr:hypothetical protein BaRGS_022560 [Batillaria attramentaria]
MKAMKTTKRYYFDNPRNGGGEVETVVIDEEKRTVCVTFKDAEDAENVSSREHVIRGQPVKVKLRVPPPTYTDKLLFQNVPEYISREHLVDFFELISSASPKEVLYGDELGVVLVTFETEPDFKEANDQCRKRKLQEKQLVVSRVPVSNCLQLENEIDITELESLTLVFEKRFHVERTSVVMDGEKLRLLLCFEDSKDLDLAMVQAKSFSINERDVHLKVFYECMGPSGGTTDPTNFEIPKPVMVDEVVDKYIIDFFCSSVAALDGFAQHLSFLHARAKIMGTSIMLECTLTPDVPQARMLARRWTTAVKQTARSYAALVDTHIMHVEDELWAEVAETVAGAGSSGSNLALAFPFDEDKTFLVVGMESAAKDLSRKISEAVTEVRRRKEEITDAGTTLRPYQLRLLQATSFFEETAKRYPGVTVQTEGLNVIFQGVLVDVLQAKTAMHDILLVELSHRVDDISERKRKLLANAEAGSYVSSKMKADGIQAGWGFNRKGELIVYALDEDDLRMAAEIIQTSVAEHDVTLRDESVRLLRSEEWQTLTQTLTTKHQGTLSISATRDGKQISITATDDIACDCRKATERFLQDNTIYSKGVSFSPARYNVLCLYMKQELLTISTDLAAQKVRITPKNAESAFTLQGTEKGLLMAERKLKEVEGKIVCHQETLNKKSKLKFLVSDKNKRDMDSLERNNQCVVSWTSDISDQQVDVVVNTTSPKLELTNGAVSASILDAAGPSLQRECRKKYPQGINPGDVAQTKGHGLVCKEVYHVTLSHWSDDAEEDLKHVMIKCLIQASNNQYTSLAFPALGTGNLNYPRDTVARVMFRVVREFEQAMPTTSLRSVRIVVYHKDAPTIQAFRQVERQSVGVYSSADGWSTAEAPPEMTCAGKRVKRNFSESAALTREEVSPERTTRHLLPSEANLFIYSTNTANVIAFLKAFEDVFAEKFTRETVLDNMIQAIEAKQMQHIEAIAQNHDAEMQVNAEEGRILLEGLEQDVFKAHHEISQYLRAMERQRVAAMIANMVQWCVLEITTTDSEQVEYPEKINHAIEAAYQAKQRTVEFTDVNNVCYVIDFDKMQEFSKDDPTDFVTVIRREKIKDADVAECQLPTTWTPNCQEFNLVQLQDTSLEFQEVTRNFTRTIGNVRVTITQVARIENPLLYRQYAAKRVHMERQNEGQQNERTLWHGTAGPTTENINRHGFNRSYCGKNATAYGQGVYFAVNSKYSAERRYSPPDASGKRYMYQCKVLVGYPTRGEENMRCYVTGLRNAVTRLKNTASVSSFGQVSVHMAAISDFVIIVG